MHRAAVITAVLIVLLSRIAAAQPDTLEGQERAFSLPSDVSVGTGTWHARAFLDQVGNVERGASEAADTIGFEVAASIPACDLFRIGGLGRLALHVPKHASAETWASGCLHIAHGDVLQTTMRLGHHLEWDVRPSLLAPLQLKKGDNRRETLTIDFTPAQIAASAMAEGASGDVVLFDVSSAFAFVWQRGGVPALVATAEAAPFRYTRARTAQWGERRDLVVDVFAGGGEFTDDAAALGVWGVRVQNAKVGPLYASAGIGITSAEAGALVDMYTHEIELTRPRVLVAIEGGNAAVHGELRATEEAQVLPDGAAAIDQRLTGGARFALPHHDQLALDGSVGRTELHEPGAMPVAAVTGGGTVAWQQRFNEYISGALAFTYARSFFAADATTTSPRWGAQLFVSIHMAIGR